MWLRQSSKGVIPFAVCAVMGLGAVVDTPPQVLYVQSVKATVRSEPKISAEAVTTLERGKKLTVLEQNGDWIKIKTKKYSGWISRLFVSTHKPIGQADLVQDMSTNLEKASRRRPSSYAVSASARGLMMGDRAREGNELYKSDYEALDKVEQYKLPVDKLETFISTTNPN